MSFPQVDAAARTDASFRGIEDPDHHQVNVKTKQIMISPLTEIQSEYLDLIKDFPIADSLHLIDAGTFI